MPTYKSADFVLAYKNSNANKSITNTDRAVNNNLGFIAEYK